MIFGISATDLLHAIQICAWIHRNYLCEDRPAKNHYDTFVSLISGFSKELQRLRDALNNAFESLATPSFMPGGDNVRQSADGAIGDFKRTLQQCCALLIEHGKIGTDLRPTFLEHTRWVFAQSRIDTLTNRINVHTQQISFILGPITLRMMTDMSDASFEMLHRSRRRDIASNPHKWPEVPSWLAEAFMQGAKGVNAPVPISDIRRLPLYHGCTALHFHVSNSTYQVYSLVDESHTIDQYVNLVKAQWLVSVLRSGGALDRYRESSVFPRFISNMELLIFTEFGRSGLNPATDDALRLRLEESPAAFAIWPPIHPSGRARRSTDPEPDEEELDISPPLTLASSMDTRDRLVCFRKKENHSILRLVPVSGPDNRPHPTYHPFRMNTRLDRFIPLYTTDQSSGPKTVRICHANDAGSDEFAFEDIAGAWAFQRAVTGYMVVGDETFVKWTGHPSVKEILSRLPWRSEDKAEAKGTGRVQVWFWNPCTGVHVDIAEEQLVDSSSSTTLTDSSPRARRSTLSGATSVLDTASVLTAKQGSDKTAVQVVSRTDGTAEAIALKSPVRPGLVCFQEHEGIYSMYHLQITENLVINPSACRCAKNPEKCCDLILEDIEESITLTILSARTGSLRDWNLSVFGRNMPPAQTQESQDVQRIKCKHLALNFPSVAARMYISERIRKAKRRLNAAEQDLARVEGEAQRTADNVRLRRRETVIAQPRRDSTVPERPELLRAPSPVSVMRGPWEG